MGVQTAVHTNSGRLGGWFVVNGAWLQGLGVGALRAYIEERFLTPTW